jgi:hypothetical protein
MKTHSFLPGDRVRFRPASKICPTNPAPVPGLHCVERSREGGRSGDLVWLIGLKSTRRRFLEGQFYATDLVLVSRQSPMVANSEEGADA